MNKHRLTMTEAWLKYDVIGPVSKREYGKKGDNVRVISISGDVAKVKGKEYFPVNVNKLSETPVKPDPKKAEPLTNKKSKR